MYQMSLGDYQVNQNRRRTRTEIKLAGIDKIVNWAKLVELFSAIDKTDRYIGGRPRKEILMMTKALFIQHLYDLSDPELEEQLNDRISFQRFAGIGMDLKVPDHSTIWRFKESLLRHGLLRHLFEQILGDIESKGLILKKGTIVDATIIRSTNRPISRQKRVELETKPSSQIDRDAQSTRKNGKYYFGYKGHIGSDVGSKIIRKVRFTAANVHDINEFKNLVSGDESSVFGDKAYSDDSVKKELRQGEFYYGILSKGRRGRRLSKKQVRKNKQLSRIRAQVEHPFAYMKRLLNYEYARARTLIRNELRFIMSCTLYNVMRAGYLLRQTRQEPGL
jgi:IS5 family transposase